MDYKTVTDAIGKLDGKIGQKFSALDAEMKHQKDELAALQMKMTKQMTGTADEVPQGVKDMIDYIRTGTKAATIANPQSGGYLAVPDYQNRVVLKMTDVNPVAAECEVITVSGNLAYLPYEVDPPSGKWVGETESRKPDSDAKLGVANIPVNDYIMRVSASNDLLDDANVANIEQYLINSATRQMDKAVGNAIISGTGFNQPKGVLTDTRVATENTLDNGSFDPSTLYDIIAGIPTEALQNAKWYMSMDTFMTIAKAFGDESKYVTMPLSKEIEPNIFGYPVVICNAPKFSTASANDLYGWFGDMRQAYKLIQRTGLEYQRDPYTGADDNLVVTRFKTRVGGQLVDPDAIIALKKA